jgi:hypothetical protein
MHGLYLVLGPAQRAVCATCAPTSVLVPTRPSLRCSARSVDGGVGRSCGGWGALQQPGLPLRDVAAAGGRGRREARLHVLCAGWRALLVRLRGAAGCDQRGRDALCLGRRARARRRGGACAPSVNMSRALPSAGLRYPCGISNLSVGTPAHAPDSLLCARPQVDLSGISPGQTVTVKWRGAFLAPTWIETATRGAGGAPTRLSNHQRARVLHSHPGCAGKPVFIKHRTKDQIAEVAATNITELRHPQTDAERTVNPDWCVCTCAGRHSLYCHHQPAEPTLPPPASAGWWCWACARTWAACRSPTRATTTAGTAPATARTTTAPVRARAVRRCCQGGTALTVELVRWNRDAGCRASHPSVSLPLDHHTPRCRPHPPRARAAQPGGAGVQVHHGRQADPGLGQRSGSRAAVRCQETSLLTANSRGVWEHGAWPTC